MHENRVVQVKGERALLQSIDRPICASVCVGVWILVVGRPFVGVVGNTIPAVT